MEVIYIEQAKTPEMGVADMLASLLNESEAFIHVGADNYPVAYVNDGEKRYCVKKVQLFDKESGKLQSEWVNLGEAKQKSTGKIDPAVVQAIAEKLGNVA